MTESLEIAAIFALSPRAGFWLAIIIGSWISLVSLHRALSVDASALFADPELPVDPLAPYRSRIAALPADQQQRIQVFLDSVSEAYEEVAVH